ncbi:MAG TPA: TlpA family protein disulfide reductase [Polyangiaceae bacterium]|nr:TlpA family protein disulfide reductase [Polyangiaceae bacterium]
MTASALRLRWRRTLVAFGFAAQFACSGTPAAGPAAPMTEGAPVVFSFGTTEGELFGSATTRGRSTGVLFVTTFDLASQAQARFLNEIYKAHEPRPHVAAVVLEPPNHRVLAEAFRTSLGLDYPVALANPSTLAGGGPFGDILGVPTLVVLDRDGRVAFRSTGAVPKDTMDAAFTAADAGRVLPIP